MSRAMHLMGALMRPLVRRVMARAADPHLLRRHLNLSARLWFRNVPHLGRLPTTYPAGRGQGMAAEWIQAGPARSDKVLLYFHGGGYIAGSPATHAKLVGRLSKMTGMRAFVPSYRLAPENPLPAAMEDGFAAYRHLLTLGYRPRDIIVGGDSAGGGLALSVVAQACQMGCTPAGAFAWSPFCDLTFSGDSVRDNGAIDHFFPGNRVHDLAGMILGPLAADDPIASPLFARFPDPPPVLLQVSTTEILRDDSLRMADHLRAQGGRAEVQTWEGAPHVWQLFDGWFPGARQAIRQTAAFINQL